MNELQSLPTLIRQARMRKGWTQREVAWQLGVGETTVRAWENGRHRPSLALQSRLEDVLTLSLSHVHQPTTSLTAPTVENVHLDNPLEQEPHRRRGMLDRARDGSPIVPG
jgi:DNA-binding XRE family transcriptional regulator